MKKLTLIVLTVLAFLHSAFAQQEPDSIHVYNTHEKTKSKLEIPKTNQNDIIISHTGYSFLYNETHEQSNWVAYDLTKEETHKLYDRTNKFIPDPNVKTETANDKDYAASGYDRGHLAPASDMGWSLTSMAESFYYSNMSPQVPSFNRGIWKKLEELMRTWAIENNSVYIVTGPVLTDSLPTIGDNKVSVPNYYYKVILDNNEPDLKGIGFIIPNTGSSESLQHFAVSIDSVEKFTGIDFFYLLPDEQENLIEKTLCTTCWLWESHKIETHIKTEEHQSSTSVQCKGMTKTGKQCRNKTLNESGHCYLHETKKSRKK